MLGNLKWAERFIRQHLQEGRTELLQIACDSSSPSTMPYSYSSNIFCSHIVDCGIGQKGKIKFISELRFRDEKSY
jgi:hypothetical protein